MNKILIGACIVGMLTTSAMAQQPQPQATPNASCAPECNFHITGPELDLISEGLQTQPFGKVVPLINKLREQLIAQQPKPAAEPKKE